MSKYFIVKHLRMVIHQMEQHGIVLKKSLSQTGSYA